jgi:hypothetical protein
MDNRRLVVLVGDSLLMDTVEASLGENQEFGVMRIYTTVTDIAARLQSLYPDAVVFDWDAPHVEFVLDMLKQRSGVPLLGLDVTCSQVTALTSEQHLTLTVNDLARVVKAHSAGKTGPAEPSPGTVLEKQGQEQRR